MSYTPRLFDGTLWETVDKRRLDPLTEMEPSHVENTIKFLQKPGVLEAIKEVAVDEFMSLPEPSGEMACYSFNEACTDLAMYMERTSPKEYFEKKLSKTKLFKRLMEAYTKHTGKTEVPKPYLTDVQQRMYDGSYDELEDALTMMQHDHNNLY